MLRVGTLKAVDIQERCSPEKQQKPACLTPMFPCIDNEDVILPFSGLNQAVFAVLAVKFGVRGHWVFYVGP